VIDLSSRLGRQVAASALAVACVLVGPRPDIVAAMERVYAVALDEDQREARRSTDRVPASDLGPERPRGRGPSHVRPARSHP
jgi:hypothetical protein